jgi:hypothetical protein
VEEQKDLHSIFCASVLLSYSFSNLIAQCIGATDGGFFFFTFTMRFPRSLYFLKKTIDNYVSVIVDPFVNKLIRWFVVWTVWWAFASAGWAVAGHVQDSFIM